MAKVFIAGAGYVGTVAAGLLAQAGHAVDTGRRTPRDEPGSHAMDVLRPGSYPAARMTLKGYETRVLLGA
jgi:2-polyprenyl-6-methoxyphenol hydroxylase-like FAD-dependent oxidoreductase